MKKFFKFISVVLLLALGLVLHLGVSYILPSPWSSLNILFVIIVSLIYGWALRSVVWVAFIYHFVIELYSSTPFGIILFSATTTTMLAFWLYEYIFTNRSWYSVFILSVITLFFYRLIYSSILKFLEIFTFYQDVPWGTLWLGYMSEIIITSLSVGLVFLFLWATKVRLRLKPVV